MQHVDQWDTVFSGFLGWVEQQPPEKAYSYISKPCCAFAQYLRAIGYPHALVSPDSFLPHGEGERVDLPAHIEHAVKGLGDIDALIAGWTFGKLAERLRASQPEERPVPLKITDLVPA